jgi:hypothetical protein
MSAENVAIIKAIAVQQYGDTLQVAQATDKI